MEKGNREKQDKSKTELINANKKRIEDAVSILSEDIKEYQRKLKTVGQQNKNIDKLSKKIIAKLSENNYEIIQAILNKKKRTNDDLNIIKTFLSTMKYLSSMIAIIDIDKILFSLSIYLKMEKKAKDSILFRFGNKGTKFYILLSGQVTILILKETFVKMCFMKFIMHLIMLKCLGEDEMVKKIIIANYQNNFHLDEKSFENIYEKVCSMGNKIMEKKNKNKKEEDKEEGESEEESKGDIEEFQDINNEKEDEENNENMIKRHKTLQLNYLVSNFNGLMNSKNYKYIKTNFKNENLDNYDLPSIKRLSSKTAIRNSRKSVIQFSHHQQNVPFFQKEEEIQEIVSYYVYLKETIGNVKKMKFSVIDYIQNTSIDSIYSKNIDEPLYKDINRYIIYKYHDIVLKNKGDTFGELALQHEDSKRTATIITNTDCIFGYLTKSAYEACLSEIELKRRKNEVNFIMSFAIFDQMNWISFENKYFNYFKMEFCPQYETILKQGEKIKKIFFIMDGQFEITTSLSTRDLFRIIKQKRAGALDKFKVSLNKKKNKIRLSICNNRDIIGLNDCSFFDLNDEEISFVNVTCISNKSIIFTLDKAILDGLKKKIPEIKDNLREIINKREKVLVDRLISIFHLFVKKREFFMNYKLGKDNIKNKTLKNAKKIGKGYKIPDIYLQKEKGNIKEDKPLSVKNRLYSANYKQARPFSKISFNKKNSIDDIKNDYSPKIKSYFSSKERLYKTKMSSEKLSLNKNYDTIIAEKDVKIKSSSTKIYLRTPMLTKKLYNKNNFKNEYPPMKKMLNREYQKLYKFIDDIHNKSERQKSNSKIENKNQINIIENVQKKLFYKEENKNDKLNLENSKFFFENDSLSLLNKEKNHINYIKNQKFKKFNKINEKKESNLSTKNSFNKKNSKSINKSSYVSFHEEDKIEYNTPVITKKEKSKTISIESYLKQILGNRYRDRDDEFISYAEKKIMKKIKDFNANLLRINKMKLKFKERMKKK